MLTPSNRHGWTAWTQCEFRFRRKADWEKQGQTGSDGGAPSKALYLCMRERGKPADEPESPPPFPNEIRTAIIITP